MPNILPDSDPRSSSGFSPSHSATRQILPVESRDCPQARDAVRDRHLRQRDHPVRSRHRHFRARPVFGYPLLEPDERREVDLVAADLMQKSRDECRRERRMIVDEILERRCQRLWRFVVRRHDLGCHDLSASSTSSSRAATRSDIRRMFSTSPRRSIVGIAHSSPSESERDFLILPHEQRDVLERDVSLGVRDQLDRDVVYSRIMRERPVRELRQLLVVASRQICPDFAECAPGRCRIVEQPVTGWTDVDLPSAAAVSRRVFFVQYSACVIEPVEQRPVAALLPRWQQPVLSRDVPRVLRKAIRTEYFTTYRADELPVFSAV